MMKTTSKIAIIIVLLTTMMALDRGNGLAQLDDRFGAKGVEATRYLGQKGLSWYRDWEDSYLPGNYPPAGKQKIWTVGKIDYRTDDLGMDYRWIILDLLEDTDVDLLQNFLNLCVAIVDSNIIPIIGDYWTKNRPLLETQLEDTLNNFTYTDKIMGIKYRARCKETEISFQEALPQFSVTVKEDTIIVNTSISADWKTHIYIEAWVLNPNPFHWGYFWKDIGNADCDFQTTISITGYINLEGKGRDRYLQVKQIVPDSKTESDIDWSVFEISFTWEALSNEIEDLVDSEIEKAMRDELNKEPITDPYYFVDFFKPLFSGEVVPTQQEILDRIWQGEKNFIRQVIDEKGYEGQYWSIGYEPNWYPMLEPAQYAAFYTKYYRLIKRLDPGAKVMGPSVLLTEAIKNFEEIAWLFIPDIFKGLLAGVQEEFKNLIRSYFTMADSKSWFSEFINCLPPDVTVDVNDFHIFPLSVDYQSLQWDSLKALMDDMALFMRKTSGADPVWVSEFGNNDRNLNETQVADLCRNFCQYFKSNTVGIERWFWFLSRGYSPFYDIPFAPKPPRTALLDNDYTLTPIGKAYLYEADCTPPIMASAVTDDGDYTHPGKIAFYWKPAVEYDTGISDYLLEVKAEADSLPIFHDWVGNQLSCFINYAESKTLYARVRAKNGAGLVGDWSSWSDGITIIDTDSTLVQLAGVQDGEKKLNRSQTSQDSSDRGNGKMVQIQNAVEMAKLPANEPSPIEVPNTFQLGQNYPNPFNASTSISYQLPEACEVLIQIFNASGQRIKTLVARYQSAGFYTVQWDGRNDSGNQVASGLYVYRMKAGKYIGTRKMAMLR